MDTGDIYKGAATIVLEDVLTTSIVYYLKKYKKDKLNKVIKTVSFNN